jgi:ubiquinone/menaquinone biosynthesis C-methylase UbiE
MLPKPEQFGERYASAFQEQGVALAYQYRPAYPDAAIATLADLIRETPRRVLDVGCGTGFIARRLVELADHVDALDISPAMIAEGRHLPGGDHPRLSWIVGRAEDAPLSLPYTLITAGDSLHWLDWQVALPRFARLLSPNGWLAVVQNGLMTTPWDAELLPIIQRYSIYKNYQSIDIVAELERRGLFRTYGQTRTEPVAFTQSVDEYVESFHGRASLARERMVAQAAAFDTEVQQLVARFCSQRVELQIVVDIVWGKPLA